MPNERFWSDMRVFVTGHTGFKGSWLCLFLSTLGAKVTGYSLVPPTNPNMFTLCGIDQMVTNIQADIRDRERLRESLEKADPDIVIHMAAQPLVRESYQSPAETYEMNALGTVYLLEAVRSLSTKGKRIRSVIIVTTDKCYENKEWPWGYRENDPLGGYDPYSSSKACAELIASSYRHSFFHPDAYSKHGVGLATARAGNVIGGGDWAKDRLFPDCIRALLQGQTIKIRSPKSIRPWQHVLEPIGGYLLLARKLHENGPLYSEGWNFGPNPDDVKTVEWIVETLCRKWGGQAAYEVVQGIQPHEACYLQLDCSKARWSLGWQPKWDISQAIEKIVEWTHAYRERKDVKSISIKQVEEYLDSKRGS
ncbi:CDP-glucose 4,6-dehydratase [Brevibacillus borstelensis]|uniref:CDP-glucose 4,6-dehydratase n=1 Tax=Brevibacillus borstelensis TaxID=45462 RepID=UPI0030BEA5E3